MDASETIGEKISRADQLEKAGQLSDAAAIYQKLFNNDPASQQVIDRLLIIYRKLKDYKSELSVLDAAIAAYRQRQKNVKEKWIQSHPQAATVGRSMLRQLEKADNAVIGLGEDPAVARWMKRKDLVTSRLTGKKRKKDANSGKAGKSGHTQKKAEALLRKQNEAEEKQRLQQENAAARKKVAQERREAAARQQKEKRNARRLSRNAILRCS